jgi:general secretion pathway protein A
MFLESYGLREDPFGVTPNPRFLYLSQTHREALLALIQGIERGRGFLTLTAEPGMGKTTLVFQLLERLRESCNTVFLFQTQCDSRELFRYLLGSLGVDGSNQDFVTLHEKLNEILARERLAGRKFVLVIDEAQNLDESVLETVRLLSDFETSEAKLIQILLVGQTQLRKKLASPDLSQLRQRISTVARLEPLNVTETVEYVHHRLRVAGYPGGTLFTADALEKVAGLSRGIPRCINNLCYNALSLGYERGQEKIDSDIVEEVAAVLDVAAPEYKTEPKPQATRVQVQVGTRTPAAPAPSGS